MKAPIMSTPEQPELKPCPFCGSEAEFFQETPSAYITVICSRACDQSGKTKEVAAREWNTRSGELEEDDSALAMTQPDPIAATPSDTPICDAFGKEPLPYITGKAPSQITAIGWEAKAREIERALTARIAELEADKALREDGARLDWLDGRASVDTVEKCIWFSADISKPLRAAIDAARTSEGREA